jgi:hypothetical protein
MKFFCVESLENIIAKLYLAFLQIFSKTQNSDSRTWNFEYAHIIPCLGTKIRDYKVIIEKFAHRYQNFKFIFWLLRKTHLIVFLWSSKWPDIFTEKWKNNNWSESHFYHSRAAWVAYYSLLCFSKSTRRCFAAFLLGCLFFKEFGHWKYLSFKSWFYIDFLAILPNSAVFGRRYP